MAVHLEKIRDEIIVLQPVYTDTGNATRILLREGECLDSRGIRSVIAALARIYALDLAAQRKSLGLQLNRHGLVPFYLGKDRVFIPLKMRKTAASKDTVYGYIDVRFMGEVVVSGEHRCTVSLPGGRQIEVMSKGRTVWHCQHMGQRLLEMLYKENLNDPDEKVLIDAGMYLHRTIKGLEQRLEHIEEVLTEQKKGVPEMPSRNPNKGNL